MERENWKLEVEQGLMIEGLGDLTEGDSETNSEVNSKMELGLDLLEVDRLCLLAVNLEDS